jgi:hypothetical protein
VLVIIDDVIFGVPPSWPLTIGSLAGGIAEEPGKGADKETPFGTSGR